MNHAVPFFSYATSFERLRPNFAELILGDGIVDDLEHVRRLEQAIASRTGAKHAIAVGNATDALIVTLLAHGIGPGDEVIVPAFTFAASATSVSIVGATPVFVDIDEVTYAMQPAKVAAAINAKTRAIMPVHLFMQMADMDALTAIAQAARIPIIEDSAEGIGMRWRGTHAGLLASAGVLSFFPTKTLGAFGDGGMILTNLDRVAVTCRSMLDVGDDWAEAEKSGMWSSRLDPVQAAILRTRLPELDAEIRRRAHLAACYSNRLARISDCIQLPRSGSTSRGEPVYYVYLIEARDRDGLCRYLDERQIGYEQYYPVPLHLQPCFSMLGYSAGDFPVAEAVCRRSVALPLYPDMTDGDVDLVCDAIEEFYS